MLNEPAVLRLRCLQLKARTACGHLAVKQDSPRASPSHPRASASRMGLRDQQCRSYRGDRAPHGDQPPRIAHPGRLQLPCMPGRKEEIVDVGNVTNRYDVAFSVSVQDPRRSNLDPHVAAGTAQRQQRPYRSAMRTNHAAGETAPVRSPPCARATDRACGTTA